MLVPRPPLPRPPRPPSPSGELTRRVRVLPICPPTGSLLRGKLLVLSPLPTQPVCLASKHCPVCRAFSSARDSPFTRRPLYRPHTSVRPAASHPCLVPSFRSLPYEQRIPLAKNAMAKRCLEVMVRKQTNLSVAADVDTAEEMLALADKVRERGRRDGGARGEGGRERNGGVEQPGCSYEVLGGRVLLGWGGRPGVTLGAQGGSMWEKSEMTVHRTDHHHLHDKNSPSHPCPHTNHAGRPLHLRVQDARGHLRQVGCVHRQQAHGAGQQAR